MIRVRWVLTLVFGVLGVLAAPARTDARLEKAKAGTDSAAVVFHLADRELKPSIVFHFASGEKLEVKPSAFTVKQDSVFVPYASRSAYERANGPIPQTTFRDVGVRFEPLGVDFYCRPNPEYYNVPITPSTITAWEKRFPDALKTTFRLEARAAGGDVELYVNGQYAGRRKRARAVSQIVLRGIAPKGALESSEDDLLTLEDTGPKFGIEWFAAAKPSAFRPLACRGTMHAGALRDAKPVLSLKPGRQTVGGVEMEVFPAEASIDTSLHRVTRTQGDLFTNYYFLRNGYNVSPEFSQWVVPNDFYTHAYVLCADVPQPGREPYVGTQLTRFCNIGSQALASGRTDLGTADAPSVGTLEWTEKGVRKTSPLKLVKVTLETGSILDLVNDKPLYAGGLSFEKLNRLDRPLRKVDDYLDFEFNGSGEWKPASSVQVFGVTLVRNAFGADMAQSEFGNLFANGEKPETGVDVTALADGVRGAVDYEIYDDAFRVVRRGSRNFALEKKGETKRLLFDLAVATNGWYGLDFTFRDASGERLFTHEAAFALLGPDTREALYDSPYAAWPHNGRHNSQPHWREIAKKMMKAGFRKSWVPPGASEAELAPWKITRSLVCSGGAPPRCSAEALSNTLAKTVAAARETLEKWPHASRIAQLLHESGGRELAQEMLYKPAVRGEYKGIDGDWTVYFCTEYAKAIHAAFPDVKVMVGNGSSASERIASLCREGFDLGLADQLGIESKGFGTMPELNANLEAPGMLWALRETGRRFGYTNFTMNACNEYVFRPERNVPRTADLFDRMWVTSYYLRDYLVSLAHGVTCISVGHLEDSKTNYYNTNWGAGCLCKAYPYGYPKRCFVAIATLTKVLDAIERHPRRLPTGEHATYALEWKRNRRTPDFASAFWTPAFPVRVKVSYPAGTRVTHVSTFGHETPLAPAADGSVSLDIGPSPVYLVSTASALKAEVVSHEPGDATGYAECARFTTSSVEVVPLAEKPKGYPMVGRFDHADLTDAEHGAVLAARLVKRDRPLPEVVWEYEHLRFRKPVALAGASTERLGLWVKGNGSFAGLSVTLADAADPKRRFDLSFDARETRGLVCWHGWRFVTARLPKKARTVAKLVVDHVSVGSAALALDPREMVTVVEPVVLGPLLAKTADGAASAAVTLTADEIAALVTRSQVADKDLAGAQLGEGKGDEKKDKTPPPPVATHTEPPKDPVTTELVDRVLKAYRKDPKKAYATDYGERETDDPLLAATMYWLGPGQPRPILRKPALKDPRVEKAKRIAEFAREITSAPPDFSLMPQFPSGVVACLKTGEGGCASLILLNFTDREQKGTFALSRDQYTYEKKTFCNLMTDDFISSGTLRFPWCLKPRGFTVLRLNSRPLRETRAEIDLPGLDLDD